MALTGILILGFFIVKRDFQSEGILNPERYRIPLELELPALVAVGFSYQLLNPILEECFWGLFL